MDGTRIRGRSATAREGRWQVEDGAIVGEQDPPGSGNGGVLLTDKKFGDFELLIDMKPDWGVCSGLFLRGNDMGQCFQMMVDYHDAGNVGQLYGEGTTGFNTRTFDINGKYDNDKRLVGISTANHKSVSDVSLVHSCKPQEWVEAWKLDDWKHRQGACRGQVSENHHLDQRIEGVRVRRRDSHDRQIWTRTASMRSWVPKAASAYKFTVEKAGPKALSVAGRTS